MSDTKKIGDRPSRRRDHERDPEWNQEQNNIMFNRLLQTLATEQQKLMVLEESRGRLMEDMRNLRARFMQENALLRRIIQRGASLEDVESLRANPSRSATRSMSFARQSPASSRQRKPTVPQQVTSRVSLKKEEQRTSRVSLKKEEQRQDAPANDPAGSRSVQVPKRVPGPNSSPKPNPIRKFRKQRQRKR
ncbi:uncharacterized protein [Drosophila pseudoobscura]|uniref:Uncharacterized protein isoform X2 n=1 Tax=Drosophila pseudoobscura pseudoobscura TaxID=46245 RepID=B5DUR0_DROPS|nr:uncharacterized protein LOC6903893 isoform X2 [Drosophila pseudoobscura]